ncbi:MAG: lysophospholipid acyltransferase family protein [Actinomycetota bacterium]
MTSEVPFRFERAPGLPGSDAASRVFLGLGRPLTRILWKLEVTGMEHVPAEGPAIICPNHLSFCDSVFVPASLPRRSWAIGKAEYMDSLSTKYLFPALGMIPVDRSGGKKSAAALDAAADVLDAGHLFMIYPEGTRSRDGDLHKGRTGAARLAMRCDAPIIPVGHQGTLDVQPPGQLRMSPFKTVSVNIGAPMRVSDFGRPGDPRVYRTMIDAVMFEIARLSGQTYVNTYAGSKAEAQTEVATLPTPPSQEVAVAPTKPPGRMSRPSPLVDVTAADSAVSG